MDLAITTAAAGATSVTVTLGATAATEDQYKDGFLYINDGATGEGHVYKIKSNAVGASGGTCVLTLDEEDGLVTALTNGTNLAGLASYSSLKSPNLSR